MLLELLFPSHVMELTLRLSSDCYTFFLILCIVKLSSIAKMKALQIDDRFNLITYTILSAGKM